MDSNDIRSFIQENMIRPPAPGEVWKFDALEAHSFHDIFMAMSLTGLISKDNPILNSYLATFKAVNDAYGLAQSDLELPEGILVTPAGQDRGFFTSLVPFFKIYVESEYAKVESHNDGHQHECKCGSGDCDRKYELPCGHTAKEHLTILTGWYEREIIATEKFAATRRAVGMVPPEERITGKPIIARSDMERVVAETVEEQLDKGLYSPQLLEDFIQSMVSVGMSRDDAEKRAAEIRESTASKMRKELEEMNEKEYRIIDI